MNMQMSYYRLNKELLNKEQLNPRLFDQEPTESFITEMVISVEAMGADLIQEKQEQAKQLLDQLFPLYEGSHREVSGYVIDYHHLTAYFRDGRHTGLQYPQHFVAYTGDRNEPDTIVFRNGDGAHVEVTLGAGKGTGMPERISVDDIQLESYTHLNSAASESHATLGLRHWISLVKSDEKGHSLVCSENKEYVSKDEADYHLDASFGIE